jgi:hypothetical protein
MRGAVQHQNHLAFELGWQNRLHIVVPPQMPGCFGCYEGYSVEACSVNQAWRQPFQTRALTEPMNKRIFFGAGPYIFKHRMISIRLTTT